jgi:glyoxylate/hydroxypyruvate reductase A
MSVAVLHVKGARAQWWKETMQALLPELDVALWDEPVDPAEVVATIVWRHPPGGLLRFPNLRVIVSIGAGVDHVFADPQLPEGVPIIRTVGPDLTQRMREYVLLHALRLHRGQPELEEAQRRGEWLQLVRPPAPRRRVGVLGLGNLGADCARALAAVGFDVCGWARAPREVPGVRVFSGAEGLTAVAEQAEILVCLLPLTPETEGVLSGALFSRMPRGAGLINCARGEHLVEEDLIPALDDGRLSRAVLDVFRVEPLPEGHPFWRHPRIDVTPHVASLIDPEAGGRIIAANLRAFLSGAPVADLVDPGRGY